MVNTSVALTFRLTEAAVRNFNRIDTAIQKMERAAREGTEATRNFNLALTAVGTAGTIGLVVAAKRAAELEDALARLETVTRTTTGTVSGALKKAEEAARDFSTQYNVAASEVISAQFQLATAGVAVEEQVEAVQGAFLLATATVGDFTQAAQLLGQFLNTFGQNAELGILDPFTKVQRITDILTSTVQRFQVTLPVLAEGFKFIIGPARQLNLQLEEVSAALGILNTAGFRGTLAGTALSNTFNKLSRAIDKLDLDPSKFLDLEGNLISLAAFLGEVNRALADTTPIEGQIKLIEVFDIRAGRVIKTLADNADQLAKTSAELELASGSTEKLAKIIQTTTSESLGQFTNALTNVGTSIGKVINEGITPVIRFLTGLVKVIGGVVEEFRLFFSILATVTTALLLYGAVAFTVGSAITALQKGVIALGGHFAALAGIIKTVIAVSIFAAVKSIKALIIAILDFGKTWAATKALVIAGATSITKVFSGIAHVVRVVLSTAILVAAETFTILSGAIKAAIASATTLTGALLLLAKISVIGIIIYGIVEAIDFLIGAIGSLIDWIGGLFSSTNEADEKMGALGKAARNIEKQFGTTASVARNLASEIELLGKAAEFGSRTGGTSAGDILGVTALSEEIRRLRDVEGLDFTPAFKKAIENLGQAGIAEDLGRIIAGPELGSVIEKNINDNIALFTRFEVPDDPLRIEEKFGQSLRTVATAQELATRAIVGDTEEISAVYDKISSSIERVIPLFKAGLESTSTARLEEGLTALVKNITTIAEISGFERVAESLFQLGVRAGQSDEQTEKFVDQLKAAGPILLEVGNNAEALQSKINDLRTTLAFLTGEGLDIDNAGQILGGLTESEARARLVTLEYAQAVSVTNDIITALGGKLNDAVGTFEQYRKAIQRADTASDRVQNTLDRLSKGAIGASEAAEKVTERIRDLSREEENLIDLQGRLADALDVAKKALEERGLETPKFIEDAIKELRVGVEKQILKVRTDIDQAELQTQIASAFENLTGVRIGTIAADNLKATSGAFTSTLAEIFSEGLTGPDVATRIENNFRNLISQRAAKQAGLAIGTNFIAGAEDKLQQFDARLVEAFTGASDRIRALFQAGDLQSAIEEITRLTNETSMATLGYSTVTEKVKEDLTDIEKQLAKIKTAQVTASATQAAALNRLSNIIDPSIGRSVESQIVKLSDLLRELDAIGQGDSPAAREAANALERLFQQGDGAVSAEIQAVNAAAAAAQESTTAYADTVTQAVSSIGAVSDRVADTLGPIFDKFVQGGKTLIEAATGVDISDIADNLVIDFNPSDLVNIGSAIVETIRDGLKAITVNTDNIDKSAENLKQALQSGDIDEKVAAVIKQLAENIPSISLDPESARIIKNLSDNAATLKLQVDSTALDNIPSTINVAFDTEDIESIPRSISVAVDASELNNVPQAIDVRFDTSAIEQIPESIAINFNLQQLQQIPESIRVDFDLAALQSIPQSIAVDFNLEALQQLPQSIVIDFNLQDLEQVPQSITVDFNLDALQQLPQLIAVDFNLQALEQIPESIVVDFNFEALDQIPKSIVVDFNLEALQQLPQSIAIDFNLEALRQLPESIVVDFNLQALEQIPESITVAVDTSAITEIGAIPISIDQTQFENIPQTLQIEIDTSFVDRIPSNIPITIDIESITNLTVAAQDVSTRISNALAQLATTLEPIFDNFIRGAELLQSARFSGVGERGVSEADTSAQLNLINAAQAAVTAASQQFVTSVQTVLAGLTTALTSLASTLTPIFDDFLRAAEILERVVNSGGAAGEGLEAIIEFNSGDTNFEINIEGTGGSTDIGEFLQEGEIQDILDEVRTSLQQDMDDKLRDLEERLRGG